MGLRRGNSQRRTTLRAISLFIIIGTIPFYLLGIGLWLLSPQNPRANNGPTFTPQNTAEGTNDDVFATFTPQGLDDETEVPTFTPQGGATYTYYLPTAAGSPAPTRYLSPTPQPTAAFTNTVPPSNTPNVAPTDVIVPPTQPPLPPASDTPTV